MKLTKKQLLDKIKALEKKLFLIAVLGSGPEAYTREFTNKVMGIIRSN